MKSNSFSRREFIGGSLAATGLAACAGVVPGRHRDRPNLVFVMSDQHSWDMLGCYGNMDVKTPRLDAFAAEGVRFNHCISNSPVCTPYRGILMTGQHPLYCGAMTNDLQILPGGGRYLGEVLRDAGYHMGYYGKWHLYGGDRVRGVPPGPFRYGFDHEFLTNNCTLAFGKENAYYWDEDGERQLYGDWEPYAQTRQAMDFVDRHADEPFVLFLSWHPPHNWGREHEGYSAPQDCLDLYDPGTLALRPTVTDTPAHRRAYQGHMGMITTVDRSFGRLMDKIDEHGLADDTLVVFTADHGDMLSSYGWPNHKGRAENTSCRVPLMMRWPRRLKPGESDMLLGALELMPTMLGLLDLPVPRTCQGTDCSRAVLAGKDNGIEEQPVFFLPGNWRGIYTRRYTYSYSVLPGAREQGIEGAPNYNVLYDRENDPRETRNLFDDPEYAAIRDELHARTLAWMARFGDAGLVYEDIQRLTVREDDLAVLKTPRGKRTVGWDTRLKGRPVDYLPAPVSG